MKLFSKFLSLLLILCIFCLPLQVQGASQDTQDYIQRMIQYYLQYQEQADEEIAVLLDYLCQVDPTQGELWRKIMVSWAYTNSRMQQHRGILPDGLPEDDSLCIVILGYDLRDDGSMKEELIDRLVVGLSSALKYPDAYVAVTGGATSDAEGVTEAGQMAQWLMDRGVEPHRIIVEPRAMSTLQNVQRVFRILNNQYPQIRELAVVTSDYHLRQCCTLFSAMGYYTAAQLGGVPVRVTGNAVNYTGTVVNDLRTQARGICAITGIPYEKVPDSVPELTP